MNLKKHIGYSVHIMIYMLLLGIGGLTACGNQDAETVIVQNLKIEGEADKVLSLENDCELWMRIGTAEDNYGQLRAYIINNASGEISSLSLGELEEAICLDLEPVWEYQDADEDGKSDIIITGTFQLADGTETTGMWVYRQTQNGEYELWKDAGRLDLIHKIA